MPSLWAGSADSLTLQSRVATRFGLSIKQGSAPSDGASGSHAIDLFARVNSSESFVVELSGAEDLPYDVVFDSMALTLGTRPAILLRGYGGNAPRSQEPHRILFRPNGRLPASEAHSQQPSRKPLTLSITAH